ncbi:heparinase II/III family protein [Steroidobacter flavus]|uniref:Heparinase II/III family protein n=1 Tax=Steroidobacter flavus TaxID=1842136 RepID=A0ABV8T105_9GAMM
MSRLGLYFHTLRHLRPIQVTSRIWLRLYRPAVDLRPAPGLRRVSTPLRAPIPTQPSLLGPTTFRLLNEQRECANAQDWHPAGVEKLWIYNLHYFDDLNASQADARRAWHVALLERWVKEVAPGQGDAWEPYPVSRRLVNWLKWALRGNEPTRAVLDSLAAQTRWLTQRLEYHLLGNHLFANAKALVFAGLYFSGSEAESWRAQGMRIVEQELAEQVLGDGGHFELSPMYHAAMLEDVLDLINVQQSYARRVPPSWHDAVARMLRWAQTMNHPDGQLSFFNDSALGIAPDLATLQSYASSLGLPRVERRVDALVRLQNSGYIQAAAGPAYLLCDCGAVGPTYLPGHAHADTLSFELSLHGQRWFVNSGTSQYGLSPERQRQRGTAAHNTVAVDEQDSSEVWAGFRVARRAKVTINEVARHPDEIVIDASHDGYRRLPGANQHRRRWSLRPEGLRIEDRIGGSFASAEAFFHLHPDVRATRDDGGQIQLIGPGDTAAQLSFEGAAAISIDAGTWHPGFGESRANVCIRVRFTGERLLSDLRW